jgi:hypothetical protein
MQNAAAAQALENVALLEEWVQLLRSRDEAAQAEAQARFGTDQAQIWQPAWCSSSSKKNSNHKRGVVYD